MLTKDEMEGSPPRMRGQDNRKEFYKMNERITPADAGTSVLELFHTSTNKDHPRGCGDKRMEDEK